MMRITHKDIPPVTHVSHNNEELGETNTGWIILRSAHSLKSASLTVGGTLVELEKNSDREYEAEINLLDGVILDVEWSEDTPETALLVSIEPEGEKSMESTYWAQGRLVRELNLSPK